MDCSMPDFPVLHYLLESESEVVQSCPILCDPMECSLPGSSIHGIFQARVLEWVVISFSRGSSRPSDWTWVSCIVGRCFTIWATREVSLSPGVCSNSCPLSLWCHPTISSSVTHFSSCLQSFQHQNLFQWVSSSHQVVKASVSASDLPINIQQWFPLRLSGLISLLSKGLSRVFSSTTVLVLAFWKYQED